MAGGGVEPFGAGGFESNLRRAPAAFIPGAAEIERRSITPAINSSIAFAVLSQEVRLSTARMRRARRPRSSADDFKAWSQAAINSSAVSARYTTSPYGPATS